jgi:hypothetical protein
MKEHQDFILVLVAIVAVVVLELVALSKGVNGVALTASVSGICSATCYGLGRYVNKSKAAVKAAEEIRAELAKVNHAR